MSVKTFCHPNNPCAGKYGNCLDVILTNDCNAGCSFCVQRNNQHYIPKGEASDAALIRIMKKHPAENILIVGGEPTLYRGDLGRVLEEVTKSKRVYMTTNGSNLCGEFARDANLHLLSGLNISIHSASEKENARIFNVGTSFEDIREAVRVIWKDNTALKYVRGRKATLADLINIRINANLFLVGIRSFQDVREMVALARHLGVCGIRLAELQGVCKEDGFVAAKDVFAGTIFPTGIFGDDPFTGGCEKVISVDDFPITVRRVCGIVSKMLPPVVNPVGRKAQTKVLQPDGVITDGFTGLPDCHKNRKRKEKRKESGSCHGGDCHGRRH